MRSFCVFFDSFVPTVFKFTDVVVTLFRSAIWLPIYALASLSTPAFAWCASNLYLRSFCLADVPSRLDLTRGPLPANDPVEPFLLPSNTTVLYIICNCGVSAAIAIASALFMVWKSEF